jgi:glucans biosynthesis protein
MQRRGFLKASSVLVAAGSPILGRGIGRDAWAASEKLAGTSRPFDYAWLKGQARARAATAHQAPPSGAIPREVKALDWDQYQSITFRGSRALWADDPSLPFQVKLFHLGLFYDNPVQIYEVVNGRAEALAYDPSMFDYGRSGLDGKRLPSNMGFAGFRLLVRPDFTRDVAAFLGASYFRAVGAELQYGMSARGLAVNCGMDHPEEFPVFDSYWLERPRPGATALTVYALMDSPSVAGAYRFVLRPGKVFVMDVDVALYPRSSIERLGVAPLTSMYQYGENDRREAADWRPEIHDSDGLSLWTGNGEWIWRPLTNPSSLRFNAFIDDAPRGFGLLQRDRAFDHYQDDGVFYEKRPSVWVEPRGGWGKGSVQLVELPAVDETIDNIVAFWSPAEPPRVGQELLFAYRLFWGAKMPASTTLAQVVATRTGVGGIVGQKRKYYSYRFVVDFAGGELAALDGRAKVEPVITVSRGKVELTSARPLASVRGYRAMFDVRPTDDTTAPIDLRLYLRHEGRPLTETWLYQWTPPPPGERRLAAD